MQQGHGDACGKSVPASTSKVADLHGSQAMGDSDKQSYMRGQKTLEINPYHPLIQELKLKVQLCSMSAPLRLRA